MEKTVSYKRGGGCGDAHVQRSKEGDLREDLAGRRHRGGDGIEETKKRGKVRGIGSPCDKRGNK